jgi:hypothetical protein
MSIWLLLATNCTALISHKCFYLLRFASDRIYYFKIRYVHFVPINYLLLTTKLFVSKWNSRTTSEVGHKSRWDCHLNNSIMLKSSFCILNIRFPTEWIYINAHATMMTCFINPASLTIIVTIMLHIK